MAHSWLSGGLPFKVTLGYEQATAPPVCRIPQHRAQKGLDGGASTVTCDFCHTAKACV